MNYVKLLLFDVDLTLIQTGGAGKAAMTKAFGEMFDRENGLDKVSFAGSTDPAIFRDGLRHAGIEWKLSLESEFKNRYLRLLEQEIKIDRPGMHIKPGITEILNALEERDDITLALLTGNWAQGARIKLEHFDLFEYFEFGAFADDAWVRSELPAIAVGKFEELTGRQITPQNVFVIGDTPRDVACAQPYGARTVAVATGFYSAAQLREAGPDHVLENLADTKKFLRLVFG